jgi:hypothetical protein
MRPFTLLIGILLGSAASITFGLAAVLVVFMILSPSHPELGLEYRHLLTSLAGFAVLTAASAGSFNAQVKSRAWRGWAHAATVAVLALLVFLYWPRGNG